MTWQMDNFKIKKN